MKKREISWYFPALAFLMLLCCICLMPCRASAKTVVTLNSTSRDSGTRILFVGNSKTYTNDIPGKFAKICKSMGKKVSVSTVAVGSSSLTETAKKEKKQISKGTYDYVVIQDHTSTVTNYSKYLKGAKSVVKLVKKKNPKVKVVVRNIWLKKTSSKKSIEKAYSNTKKVAKKLNARISQDGPAFELCKQKYPGISLYTDNKHPSKRGAYLSACCVYCAIFRESPVGCKYYGGISKTKAKKLQQIAAAVSF